MRGLLVGRWLAGPSIPFQVVALLLSALCLAAPSPAAADFSDTAAVIDAIFNDPFGGSDRNGDSRVNAADVVAVLLQLPTPTPSATPSPSPTATATTRPCPTAGAALAIAVDNLSGLEEISILVSGERLAGECAAGTLATAYTQTFVCSGTGTTTCGQLAALAPGSWRHSLQVLLPDTGQLQHQRLLLIAGEVANRADHTVFATVWSITTTANAGDGSLRKALQDAAGAAKPLLLQFDPLVFPPGVLTAVGLEFALPALAADDVTIDGTDETGASGNRVIDANALPIGALAITGARNRLIGLRLRNAGSNNRDVLNINGPAADGNVVERTLIDTAGSADGIGVDQQAGKDFAAGANVIRDCEITGAADKGIKVTTGAYARIERSWVHDNANGGIQATLGGHVQAIHNLVERNRGASAQNGLAANAMDDDGTPTAASELVTWGNLARGNGANGISVRAFSIARLRDDYLAANGSSGLRVFNDVGPAASAVVQGTSMVCNGVDGAVVANGSTADFGGGGSGSPGHNAFTQNNLPAGGSNLRNASASLVNATNNQWEHCGGGSACAEEQIAADDLSDHGRNTAFVPAQAHRAQLPVITAVAPAKGERGELLRIFGSGFNVIDGHFAEDNCADVAGRNRCMPVRGNCVQIGGVAATVEAVTPTMLVVRWPFTCVEPVTLVVKVDQGPTVAISEPFSVCTNDGS